MKTKTIFSILAILALLILPRISSAQFTVGGSPGVYNALTNLTTWEVRPADGATAATNISTAQAQWCPVGLAGYGVAIKSYATNAALTTNTWIVLEHGVSISGTIQPITNNNVTVVLLPRGVATNTYFTNFVGNSSAVFGNVTHVRAKNIMQTNGVIGGSLAGTLFVEAFVVTSK